MIKLKYFNDDLEWLKDNKLHRTGGPALDYSGGLFVRFYIKSELCSLAEYISRANLSQVKKSELITKYGKLL